MRTAWDRLVIALASRTLPARGREWMTGDLEEHYAAVRAEAGAIRAAGWLAGECIRIVKDRVGHASPHGSDRPCTRSDATSATPYA